MPSTEVRYVDAAGVEVSTTVGAVDVDRLARALPVRRFGSHRGQRHRSGLFWSATTRGHVPYESRLELDRLWLADFDPAVTWIAAQPMWLSGRQEGCLHRHVPDFLLTRRGLPPLIVDVKPEEFAARPEAQGVFAWTDQVCRAAGWGYQVWTGADPVVLANIRTLAVARRFLPPTGGLEEGSMLALLSEVWTGRRVVDLSVPLSSSDLRRVEAAS